MFRFFFWRGVGGGRHTSCCLFSNFKNKIKVSFKRPSQKDLRKDKMYLLQNSASLNFLLWYIFYLPFHKLSIIEQIQSSFSVLTHWSLCTYLHVLLVLFLFRNKHAFLTSVVSVVWFIISKYEKPNFVFFHESEPSGSPVYFLHFLHSVPAVPLFFCFTFFSFFSRFKRKWKQDNMFQLSFIKFYVIKCN